MPTNRTGLLIIRAWIEDGSEAPLRAHVRIIDDISVGAERAQTLARGEEVVATVQAWLADFLSGHPPG